MDTTKTTRRGGEKNRDQSQPQFQSQVQQSNGQHQQNQQPQINSNPTLQQYYASLESRIGYRLFLGDTRHYGWYPSSNSSPFPISTALRAMEEQLYLALNCASGSKILDAGCGVGHVAMYMARRNTSYKIEAIDVVSRHAEKARTNIRQAGLEGRINANLGDYHHLEHFASDSFDGVYTMETLVHSTNPLEVLRGFFRILKPGGRLAMNEYDHEDLSKSPKVYADAMKKVNLYAAMPANASFDHDVLKDLAIQAGFEDVVLRDLSENVVPMLWLFYVVAWLPCMIFKLFGVEHWFVNTLAGLEGYRGRKVWRYVQVTGRKPLSLKPVTTAAAFN